MKKKISGILLSVLMLNESQQSYSIDMNQIQNLRNTFGDFHRLINETNYPEARRQRLAMLTTLGGLNPDWHPEAIASFGNVPQALNQSTESSTFRRQNTEAIGNLLRWDRIIGETLDTLERQEQVRLQQEQVRLARERQEQVRLAREQQERERLARDQLERARQEQVRLAREQQERQEERNHLIRTQQELNQLLEEINEQQAQLQADIGERQAQLQTDQREIGTQRAQLQADRQNFEAQRAQLQADRQNFEAQQAQLQAERQKLETRQAQLQETQREIDAQQAQLQAQLQETQREIDARQAQLQADRQKLETRQTQLQGNEAQQAQLQEDIEALRAQLEEEQQEVNQLLTDINVQQVQLIEERWVQLQRAQVEIETLQTQLQNQQQETQRVIDALRAQLQAEQDAHRRNQLEMRSLQNEIGKRGQTIQGLQDQKTRLSNRLNDTQTELRMAQLAQFEANDKLDTLQAFFEGGFRLLQDAQPEEIKNFLRFLLPAEEETIGVLLGSTAVLAHNGFANFQTGEGVFPIHVNDDQEVRAQILGKRQVFPFPNLIYRAALNRSIFAKLLQGTHIDADFADFNRKLCASIEIDWDPAFKDLFFSVFCFGFAIDIRGLTEYIRSDISVIFSKDELFGDHNLILRSCEFYDEPDASLFLPKIRHVNRETIIDRLRVFDVDLDFSPVDVFLGKIASYNKFVDAVYQHMEDVFTAPDLCRIGISFSIEQYFDSSSENLVLKKCKALCPENMLNLEELSYWKLDNSHSPYQVRLNQESTVPPLIRRHFLHFCCQNEFDFISYNVYDVEARPGNNYIEDLPKNRLAMFKEALADFRDDYGLVQRNLSLFSVVSDQAALYSYDLVARLISPEIATMEESAFKPFFANQLIEAFAWVACPVTQGSLKLGDFNALHSFLKEGSRNLDWQSGLKDRLAQLNGDGYIEHQFLMFTAGVGDFIFDQESRQEYEIAAAFPAAISAIETTIFNRAQYFSPLLAKFVAYKIANTLGSLKAKLPRGSQEISLETIAPELDWLGPKVGLLLQGLKHCDNGKMEMIMSLFNSCIFEFSQNRRGAFDNIKFSELSPLIAKILTDKLFIENIHFRGVISEGRNAEEEHATFFATAVALLYNHFGIDPSVIGHLIYRWVGYGYFMEYLRHKQTDQAIITRVTQAYNTNYALTPNPEMAFREALLVFLKTEALKPANLIKTILHNDMRPLFDIWLQKYIVHARALGSPIPLGYHPLTNNARVKCATAMLIESGLITQNP
ncbi:MAG: hypothetical protein LBJ71_02415 [Holosporaceae bacterium]|nr:hypothetical protein [Holosporaceae bacterium]